MFSQERDGNGDVDLINETKSYNQEPSTSGEANGVEPCDVLLDGPVDTASVVFKSVRVGCVSQACVGVGCTEVYILCWRTRVRCRV